MEIKINIPAGAKEIIDILYDNGHEAYVVGGCVRDSILGRKPNDWDICTSATPGEMLSIFKGKRMIETGLQHGTITVIADNTPYEVTTYRIDGKYSDNRHPDSVTFTDKLTEDLRRRDFTINAMAYNDREGLIDPFDGQADLRNEMIRCVGSARERFEEDALRILRAIRFSSQLGFLIARDTVTEIFLQKENLNRISIERVQSEFCKIISSHYFSSAYMFLRYRTILEQFIPEIHYMTFEQRNPYHEYDVFHHTLNALKNCISEDIIVKLAVLFHDIGKPHCYQDDPDGTRHFRGHGGVSAAMTDEIMKRMRFDNDTRKAVVELVEYHDATFEVGKKYVRRWLNKIGEVQFRRLLQVRRADIRGQKIDIDSKRIEKIDAIEAILEEVLQENDCFSINDLAINGNDVQNYMKLRPGRMIGEVLNTALNHVIEGEMQNNREELIQWMTGVADGWIEYRRF